MKKIPRAYFKYTQTPAHNSHADLKKNLISGFKNSNYLVTKSHISPSFARLTIGTNSFSIAINKSRHHDDFYVVSVIPSVSVFFYIKKQMPVPREFNPGLRAICSSVDVSLRNTPGVELIYWYFEWGGVRTESVWTPQELSWDE